MELPDILKIGIAVFSAAIAAAGLFIGYKKYENEAFSSKQADSILADIVSLKTQLYGFNETIKLLIQRWQIEKQNPDVDNRFESLELVYKHQAKRIADFITGMESNGNLLFLFRPQDELWVRILGLRAWLEVDANSDHPLHSTNGEIVDELTIGQSILESYSQVLHYLHEIDRAELHKTVKYRLGQMRELDDEEEITRLLKLFNFTDVKP